jgi:hypothetical protein
MKKLFILFILALAIQQVQAQHKNKFRMGMDLGLAIPEGGGFGATIGLEPKINLADNINIGVKFSLAGLAKDVVYLDNPDDYEGDVSGNSAILGTLDYYFNKGRSKIAPFVGGGFGYYGIANLAITDDNLNPDDELEELEVKFAWAPMVRGGIEIGKFRLTAEYHIVPPTDLQNITGKVIGEAINQYFSLTAGFYIGGGKWKTHEPSMATGKRGKQKW